MKQDEFQLCIYSKINKTKHNFLKLFIFVRINTEVFGKCCMFLIFLSETFANHPFVQQLADLSFETEDIKTAMRHFTQSKGTFVFSHILIHLQKQNVLA